MSPPLIDHARSLGSLVVGMVCQRSVLPPALSDEWRALRLGLPKRLRLSVALVSFASARVFFSLSISSSQSAMALSLSAALCSAFFQTSLTLEIPGTLILTDAGCLKIQSFLLQSWSY